MDEKFALSYHTESVCWLWYGHRPHEPQPFLNGRTSPTPLLNRWYDTQVSGMLVVDSAVPLFTDAGGDKFLELCVLLDICQWPDPYWGKDCKQSRILPKNSRPHTWVWPVSKASKILFYIESWLSIPTWEIQMTNVRKKVISFFKERESGALWIRQAWQ